MAFWPLNGMFAAIFLFGVAWGWEGEAERQFFSIISSIFMFPLWLLPLYSIVESSGTITIAKTVGWLPTGILENALFWNAVLMYFTASHFMESLQRQDPLGRLIKRMRKR